MREVTCDLCGERVVDDYGTLALRHIGSRREPTLDLCGRCAQRIGYCWDNERLLPGQRESVMAFLKSLVSRSE